MEQRFRGTSTHKVDAKGRVSIPADFRRVLDACDPGREEGMNPRLVLCHGDHRVPYYTVYTITGAAEMGERIEDMDDGDPQRLALEEYFYEMADTVSIDDSGRLILNAGLRDRIAIGDSMVFAGRGTSFRIYAAEVPESAVNRLRGVLDDLPAGVPVTALLPKKRPASE